MNAYDIKKKKLLQNWSLPVMSEIIPNSIVALEPVWFAFEPVQFNLKPAQFDFEPLEFVLEPV